MTLSVFENFGVWIYLSDRQLGSAARLVEVIRERGRFALQEVPILIPTEREREQIVAALRVAQVIDIRPADGIAWLYIGSLAPGELTPALTMKGSGEQGTAERIRD